jgi:ABC-type transport system involved in multi-copper enzyme maturation permease subunit
MAVSTPEAPSAGESRSSPRGLLARVREWTHANPVLTRELRTRMRGTRAHGIVFGYLFFLAGVALTTYYGYWSSWSATTETGRTVHWGSAAEVGRGIFSAVFCTQGVLIALITPALTVGAITTEREQRTYEMLSASPLSAAAIIRGKLAASVLFVLLLLASSLPLVAVSLFFGGVSPEQIGLTCLVLASTAFSYGAIGLIWSAALRRTAAATVGAYLCGAALFFSTLALGSVVGVSGGNSWLRLWEATVPFKAFNGATAAWQVLQPEFFFRWTLPTWPAGIGGNLVLGLLLATAASEQLEGFDARRPLLRRGLATLGWVVLWTVVCGSVLGRCAQENPQTGSLTIGAARPYFIPLLVGLVVTLAAVAPPVLTGAPAEARGASRTPRWRALILPWRWPCFSDDPAGGPWLAALWGLMPSGIIVAGSALSGLPVSMIAAEFLIPSTVVVAGVWLAACGVGAFWTQALNRRWYACVAAYLTLVFLLLFPSVFLAGARPADWLPWQALYLLPTQVIADLGSTGEFRHLVFDGICPAWLVNCGLYAAIGALGYVAAALVARRRLRLPRGLGWPS